MDGESKARCTRCAAGQDRDVPDMWHVAGANSCVLPLFFREARAALYSVWETFSFCHCNSLCFSPPHSLALRDTSQNTRSELLENLPARDR